jgi:hypothetical protein
MQRRVFRGARIVESQPQVGQRNIDTITFN